MAETAPMETAVRGPTWPPSPANREQLVERMTANLMSLSFFSASRVLPDEASARSAVEAVEEVAFTEASALAVANDKTRMTHYIKVSSAGLLAAASKAAAAGAAAPSPMVVEAVAEAVEGAVDLDISGGKREFLTLERAEELLAAPAAAGPLRSVKLSGKSFGLEAADVAARILSGAGSTLRHADLSDIIAGRPEDEALQVLTKMTDALAGAQLSTLDLSDNAFGEKGIRACGKLLQAQRQLEAVSFCNNGISVQAAAAIAELMADVAALRKMHLFNNMSGDGGAAEIARVVERAAGLRDFKMACSRVSTAGAEALARALRAGRELESLDLHDNNIGEEGGAHLASLLHEQPRLRVLNLSELGLCDAGVTAVADALAASAPDLEVLELSCNELTAAGARALARCLAGKTALRRLAVAENELGDKGAVLLAKALGALPQLEEADFCQNEIRRVGAVALAKAVGTNATLKLLALNGNFISEDGVAEVEQLVPAAALGPLDENDPEGAEEEEEGEEEAEEEEGEDELESALDKLKL